jgi:hypothetical protein
MVEANGNSPEQSSVTVNDDGKSVDQKIKTRIIEARKRVDRTEEALFVRADLDPDVQMGWEKKVLSWGRIVKQFLRAIEPLLKTEGVTHANQYYEQKKIGEFVLVPPATSEYDFTLVRQLGNGIDADELRLSLGLPPGVTLPEPRTISFEGLKSVIESDTIIEERWSVVVDNNGPPKAHEKVYPRVETVVPIGIYRDAVRIADEFLQQAGIGLEIQAEKGDAGYNYSDLLDEGPPGSDGGGVQ